ncbi:A24 family peptidase [Caulobacter sp. NIBR2454]|uniref:A24 family peptidase n=1 Tax=Caulobacter sp. NIBR2454 TaxID=3015996 RepID=UPI0022B5F9AF|nr:prepilin peptidase [Caulobacter sp. NIBR2454]
MLAVLVFPILLVVGGLKDLTSFTIPNWISLALVAAFPLAAILCGVSWAAAGLAVLVGMAALVMGMGMFALGWIGGGDAKLMAAAALWLGWPAIAPFMLVTALAGGGLAVGLLALRSPMLRPLALGRAAWVDRLADPTAGAPYGVAICVGALAAFPHGVVAKALFGASEGMLAAPV